MVQTENYVPLNRVTVGSTIQQVFLVVDSQSRRDVNNNPYLNITVRDVTGELTLFVWGVSATVHPGTYIHCSAEVKIHKDKLTLTTRNISPAKRPDNIDLFIKGEADSALDVIQEEVKGLMDKVYDNDIGLIYKHFNELNLLGQMATFPFGARRLMHKGGLLVHTFNLTKLCVGMANALTQTDVSLDKDMLRLACLCRNLGYTTSYELKGDIWQRSSWGELFSIRDASWACTRDLTLSVESAYKITLPEKVKFTLLHLVKIDDSVDAVGEVILSGEDILSSVYANRT